MMQGIDRPLLFRLIKLYSRVLGREEEDYERPKSLSYLLAQMISSKTIWYFYWQGLDRIEMISLLITPAFGDQL